MFPTSVTDKMLSLVVGGGASINAMEFRFSALGGASRDSRATGARPEPHAAE